MVMMVVAGHDGVGGVDDDGGGGGDSGVGGCGDGKFGSDCIGYDDGCYWRQWQWQCVFNSWCQ